MRNVILSHTVYVTVSCRRKLIIIIIMKTLRRPLRGLSGTVQYMHVHKKLKVKCHSDMCDKKLIKL